MMKLILVLLLTAFHTLSFSQATDSLPFTETEVSISLPATSLHGTLTVPITNASKMPVALIIAGSGPTDRNGNNNSGLKTDAYKLLAHALAANGIASLRYDKRGVGESRPTDTSGNIWAFSAEAMDAAGWLPLLQKDKRFSKVIVIGHSQGSLVGLLMAKEADQFISIAGLGYSADVTLKRQLSQQPKMVADNANRIIDSMLAGHLAKDVPPYLQSLFNPPLQRYLISWFRYDPAKEIASLNIPCLVVQGTNDVQVTVDEAQKLAASNKQATLALIENMNHLFRIITGSRAENLASYAKPELPIADEMVNRIVAFIKEK